MGAGKGVAGGKANKVAPTTNEGSLPHRMLALARQFQGKVLLVLSSDLTAQEFIALGKGSRAWQAVLAGCGWNVGYFQVRTTPFSPGVARSGCRMDAGLDGAHMKRYC